MDVAPMYFNRNDAAWSGVSVANEEYLYWNGGSAAASADAKAQQESASSIRAFIKTFEIASDRTPRNRFTQYSEMAVKNGYDTVLRAV